LNFEDALACTLTTLGLGQLKPKQVNIQFVVYIVWQYEHKKEETVRAVTLGKDVFVILPTGYGKSMIYAILPTLYDFMFGELNHPICTGII